MSTFYDRFFKQVKNKPIRWSSWDKYEFFIPKELGYDNWMYGITAGVCEISYDEHWTIVEGFEPDYKGEYWNF